MKMSDKDRGKPEIRVDKNLQKVAIEMSQARGQTVEAYQKLRKGVSALGQSLVRIGKNIFSSKTETKAVPGKQLDFAVCKDKNSPSSLLDRACKAEMVNQTLRMELLESLRSSQAFQNAAIVLKGKIDFTDRTFSALYPGGGSHIAPIVMAMLYMDENLIDTATFSYTEIDPVKLEQLEYILRNIASVAPSLKYNENDKKSSTCDNTVEGTETTLTIFYKGKPIHFRFLLSCSGESYFQPVELSGSKVFISHDSAGEDVYSNIEIVEEYIRAAKMMNMKQKLPPIIMEDLSRSAKFYDSGPYVRFLDLEFLGKVIPVNGAFGHRKHVSQPLKYLSPEQIKRLEDLKKYGSDLETSTVADLEKWKAAGSVPESHGQDQLKQDAELGYPSYSGAVIFEMNPAVLSMDKENRTLILETQVIASGNTADVRRGPEDSRFRLPPNDNLGLFSKNTFLDIAKKTPEMLDAVRKINPAYEQVFAYRLAQSLMQLRIEFMEAIEFDPNIRERIISAAQSLYKYLNPSQQSGLRSLVAQINELWRFIKNDKRYLAWKKRHTRQNFFYDNEETKLFYKNHPDYKKFDEDMEKSIGQLENDANKALKDRIFML